MICIDNNDDHYKVILIKIEIKVQTLMDGGQTVKPMSTINLVHVRACACKNSPRIQLTSATLPTV